MPKTDTITQARLKELLHYDPETGDFIWLVQTSPRIHIGDIAGCIMSNGYRSIGIDGVIYLAHRLAFMDRLGWMPVAADHDNHIRDDNRWINLNPATSLINNKNRALSSANTSGYIGICWDKYNEKWEVRIIVEYKRIFIGRFNDLSDAIAARKAAEIKYGFHVNHGLKLGEADG